MAKYLFFLLAVFFTLSQGVAEAMERFDIVSTQQLEELLQQRKSGDVDFILVNSLDEVIFRDAHIPGSINLPLSRVDQLIDRLGTDRDKLIIPY